MADRPVALWIVPWYPPDYGGGAEWTAHEFSRFLIRTRNFRVIVASAHCPSAQFDGVEVHNLFDRGALLDLVRQSGILFTQLDHTELAAHAAARFGLPLVHFIHSTFQPDYLFAPEYRSRHYVVYNAEWVRDALRFPQPSIVARPPVDWRRYQVDGSRRCVTLINIRRAKGLGVFLECARRLPETPFLAVHGCFGRAAEEVNLANLAYRPFTPDVREILAETRVLLMPSDYESWGRAGVEAMASGIPVIAHPTPGLRESLADAGLFVDRDRVDDWVEMIRRLEDLAFYERISRRCVERSRELDPAEDLERFGQFIDTCLAG